MKILIKLYIMVYQKIREVYGMKILLNHQFEVYLKRCYVLDFFPFEP